MPDERIETLRRMADAFNRGDYVAAATRFHPEIELARPGAQSPYRGVERVREWMKPDAFAKQSLDVRDFEPAGGGVLAHVPTSVTGATSGLEMDVDAWAFFTFDDDDLITRIALFLDRDEARSAAGLAD